MYTLYTLYVSYLPEQLVNSPAAGDFLRGEFLSMLGEYDGTYAARFCKLLLNKRFILNFKSKNKLTGLNISRPRRYRTNHTWLWLHVGDAMAAG